MRKILIIILMLMALPCFAARKPKPPVKYLQFEPNVQTKQVCYKVEDFEEKDGSLYFYFEESLSDMLFTERLVEDVYDALRRSLPPRYKKRSIKIISKNYPIEEFVPNHRRIAMKTDSARIGKPFAPHNVVSRLSLPYPAPASGLYGRNIVLWPSHGLYFNAAKDRWEWQRPRLFGTVEDLMSVDVCLNYVLPMLRNAGAEVFMPRERDIRTETADFAIERTEDSLHCTLKVPKAGYYWLKMWYTTDGTPSREVKFSVSRNGIKTEYAVNAGVGNGTWIYVDKLYFDGEARADFATGDGGGFCLDTLRIGGGFSASGNGMPAYVDGARYFLQASNVPDSILYCGKEGRIGDYYDDLYEGVWEPTIKNKKLTEADKLLQRASVADVAFAVKKGMPLQNWTGIGQMESCIDLSVDECIEMGLDGDGLLRRLREPLIDFEREHGRGIIATQLWMDKMHVQKDPYNWQKQIGVETIDESLGYNVFFLKKILKLVQEKVKIANAEDVAHYEGIIIQIENVLRKK